MEILNLNSTEKNCQNDILEATKCGHLDQIRFLQQSGASLDCVTESGWTALHLAALHHHYGIAKYLLKHGVGVNVRNDFQWTPLHIACAEGQFQMVNLLLRHGAEPNAQNETGTTPLMCAAYGNHLGILRRLLQEEVQIDLRDNLGANALMIAASYGTSVSVKLLIEAGASLDSETIFGDSPLTRALTHANLSTFRELIGYYPDLNILDEVFHETPLYKAVDMLKPENDPIHSASNKLKGLSPMEKLKKLHKIQLQIVKLLVGKGASIHFKHGLTGNTILELAYKTKNQPLISFLSQQAKKSIQHD